MISGISPVSLRPALFTAELGTPPRKPFLEQLSLSQSLTFLSAVFQPLAVFKSLISFILSGMAAASQSLQQSRLPVSKSSAWPTAPPRNSASSTSWSCDDHQHSDSGRQLHPDVVFPVLFCAREGDARDSVRQLHTDTILPRISVGKAWSIKLL